MKLSARETEAFLKAPDRQSRAVLLYGPDGGLVRERSRHIAQAILGLTADPMNRVDLTSDDLKSDPARLRDELSALSLMGGRRLVVLRASGEKVAPVIVSALEGLETTTYLIIEAEELSPSSALRALFEKNAAFVAVACYRDEGRNLEEMIRASLNALGLRASHDALRYLADHLGNDRGVTQSELARLALYMGDEKEVTLEIAQALSGYNASETIEDICHAVAGGRQQEAHALLMRLLNEGTQPVAVVRALMKHFQRLEIVNAHIAAGAAAEQAVAQLRPPVFFKYVPLFKRELSLWRARSLANVLTLLLRAEKELKSSLLPPALLASQTIQQATRMAG